MNKAIQYLDELKKIDIAQATEHSLRSLLESLLKDLAQEVNKDISVLQEPKRQGKFGTPDFKISNTTGIIGYCETKKIGENLAEILKTPQIKKYLALNSNLLVTDYLTFIWLKGETEVRKVQLEEATAPQLENLIKDFYRETPQGISTAKELAKALAIRTKFLKDSLQEVLENQIISQSTFKLVGLYQYFKNIISENFTTQQFSDAFAQTLSYSLFLAKLNAEDKNLHLQNIRNFISYSFPVIREISDFLENLEEEEYKSVQWVVNEIITIINGLNIVEIQKSLSFNQTSLPNQESSEDISADPYLYFYEDFLGQYNSSLRKAKGVYYTPPAVVNFIVRAVHEVLQTEFGIGKGLADKDKVTVLDFATGTGTFILEILKVIFRTVPANSTLRPDIVKNHILKNMYGFEYLMAPYTIAHLKLSQFLKDNHYEMQKNERLQIYLTNTLEPLEVQINMLLPELSKEGTKAQAIKKQPILIITGNPPYSGHSTNKGAWISEKMNDYKKLGNEKLEEKNPKWLQDDYVKFIRFAEWKMQEVEQGMVAIITNHSFLDNPTFRLMRKSLLQTFDKLYVVDLHGNAKKKEISPDGSKDQNVFDIEQGVSISIFIKTKQHSEQKKQTSLGEVYHADFYGNRQAKFDLCLENSLKTVQWETLQPHAPFYLFKPQDTTHKKIYDEGWSVKDIFNINSVGIVTARDNLTIQATEKQAFDTAVKFVSLKEEEARFHFSLGEDARDWKVTLAQEDLRKTSLDKKDKTKLDKSKVVPIAYRPFDIRYTYYTGKSRGFHCMPRGEVMKHFLHKNIGLITIRRSRSSQAWNFVFASDKMISGSTAISSLDINYFFPLYIYQQKEIFSVEPNSEFGKALKELEKNFKPIQAYYEKHKAIFDAIEHPTTGEHHFFEEARTFYEEHLAQFEKNVADLKKQHPDKQVNKAEGYDKVENFTPAFKDFIATHYAGRQLEAREIFNYLYAVLHSPTYREKYKDFLKMDFPKIPFVADLALFQQLSKLGHELSEAHLLESGAWEQIDAGMPMEIGSNEVKEIRYQDNRLYYNEKQYFDKVSTEVWDFQIGGYKVLEKYLKDRKGKNIFEEIGHIERIIKVLTFTLQKMNEIDQVVHF
jgi:predicted helicase